jgi:membrane protease YdiL (CAAX protease family)
LTEPVGPEAGSTKDPGLASDGLPEPRWGLGDVVITLGLDLAFGFAAAYAVLALVDGPLDTPTGKAWSSIALLVVPWLGLAGWPLYVSRTRGNGPVRDFGLRLSWRAFGIGVAGGVTALVVASIVGEIEIKIRGHDFSAAVEDLAKQTTSASHGAIWVLALCTFIGAPIVEELAFRGLTYGALRKMGLPVVYSVLWTTVVFALFHFEFVRLPVLLVIGGCLGAVRAYTGSTSASMVSHMVVNLPGAIGILALAH